jgi:hypothetical protein
MEKLSLNQKCMSFGNNSIAVKKSLAVFAAIIIAAGGLVITHQLKAASNCTGPTFDAGTKTLSLVCTESTDTHELSCADATNPDILSLTVNGLNDTVTCPPDVPPNTLPTVGISGPTSGDWGTNYTFTITGTDVDAGDTLVYHVDWNNDGTADYVSGSVSSGTGVAVANSWSALGAQTFQAMAIDNKGGASTWVPHTITISNPPPATASLQVRVNGGGWSSSDQTVDPTDTVELQWNSTNASSCSGSGSGFVAAATSGTDGVNTPAANSSANFQVTCSGPGGNGSDSLTVTTRQLPNFTEPTVRTPAMGAFNQSTGMYNGMTVSFRTENNGGSNIPTDADYRFRLDLNNDGSFEVDETRINALPAGMGVGSGTDESESISLQIPIGSHRIIINADSSGNPGKVTETNEGDNLYDDFINIPASDPGLTITVTPERVQNGQNATVTWRATTPYPMNCSVFGPGMTTRNFNLTSAAPADNNISAGPLTAKSEYTIRCDAAGTIYTATDTVETQGVLEEI